MTTNPTPLETAMQDEPQQAILARAWKLWALFTKATPDKTVALDTLVGFLTTQCEKLYARNLELTGDPFGKQLTEVEAERDALRERVKDLEESNQVWAKGVEERAEAKLQDVAVENAQLRERVEAQRWIPVTEMLPTTTQKQAVDVLVCYEGGAVETSTFYCGELNPANWFGHAGRTATHWQPLPTAPTEKGGEAE